MTMSTLYYIEPGDQGNVALSPLTDDAIVGGYDSASGEATMDSDFNQQYAMSDISGSYAGDPLTTLAASASAGATTISTNAKVLAGWGIEFSDGTKYRVTAVSGSSAPYTYTLDHPLETSESSGATVDYYSSGNVTVSYLTIERFTGDAVDVQDFRDPGWVVSDDTLTLNNNTTPTSQPSGDGFDGNGTITDDCISDNGQHGLNMFGIGGVVSHDEFTGNGTHLDEGCGCIAGLHAWQTTNLTISDNYFYADRAIADIWLDTDNTGYPHLGELHLPGTGQRHRHRDFLQRKDHRQQHRRHRLVEPAHPVPRRRLSQQHGRAEHPGLQLQRLGQHRPQSVQRRLGRGGPLWRE